MDPQKPKKSRVQGGGWGNPSASSKPTYQAKSTQPTKSTQQPQTKIEKVQTPFSHLVVHVKKSPYDVYIGRKNPDFPDAAYGNPFKIPEDGERDVVIAKYRTWLTTTPEGQTTLSKAKKELPGKRLACWCAPLACHGHVLAELVNQVEPPSTQPDSTTPPTPEQPNTQLQKSLLPKNPKKKFTVITDGCVLITNAFSIPEQQFMVDSILKYGRGQIDGVGSFYAKPQTTITYGDGYADPLIENSDPTSGILNLVTKARMNVPFKALEETGLQVWDLCNSLLQESRKICESIPDVSPTVWRLNYYSKKGKIGWHFDRHPGVPMDLQHTVKDPVLSVSLGDAGMFDYRPLRPTPGVPEGQDFKSVRLNSGDCIIFGGPARQLVHRLSQVYANTKPSQLNMYECPGRLNFGFYNN